MTESDPDFDADVARLMSAGNFDAAIVGAIVLLLAWPIARLLRRRQARRTT